MHQDEIRQVVAEVLAEQRRIAVPAPDADDVVLKTMAAILTSFGINDEDRVEIRADFIHLRKWRKSVEQTQRFTVKAIVTVIVGGVLGALWMGIKTILGK